MTFASVHGASMSFRSCWCGSDQFAYLYVVMKMMVFEHCNWQIQLKTFHRVLYKLRSQWQCEAAVPAHPKSRFLVKGNF